jgi:hypothetical protein
MVINSTLLMSFDVGKSRISEFLTMRNRTKEELASYNPNRKAAYHPDFTPIGLWTKAAYNKK